MPGENHVAVKVWDLPVRLFHWILTVLFVAQVVTGKIGGELMPLHMLCGYAILTLIVFRILWGFAGSTHSRFASFMAGPRATIRFAKRLFSREAVPQVGHNPLGGWNVILMVVAFAVQAASGLFTNDGVSHEGPLSPLVSLDVSNLMTDIHAWTLKVLLLLVGVHLAAIVFHLVFKKDELIRPMFTGIKRVPPELLRERREARRDKPPRRVASRETAFTYTVGSRRALGLLILAIAVVTMVVQVLPRVVEHAPDRNIPGFE